ncbi:hypothetical protein HRG_005707 [Hirsutella rhossiliensis]|uniref:Uncharacterized protein n=1 Tax=Hirsutella rhossiliensis TaxID=111463 RepID=A0A9P8MXL1_9HYPO|nr:uncharacterized protein HRG_05707 [Hirsutella rhossiliensis]KAH0963197.1 hypothetical protein HRG_05707 [Hirsutella rhossiliensis]
MALVSPVALNLDNLKTAYRFLVDPSPHLDHALPLVRALGLHAFRLQDEVLGVPLRWGFFSPGPSRLQAMEACLFASLLATAFLVVSIVAVCLYRGESYQFLLCCSTVIPVACASTYIKARRVSPDCWLPWVLRDARTDDAQYRQWVPPSWKRPSAAK